MGIGGGSIAKVTQEGLQIGPESAGANPGPACFGKGGKMATVTDADVVLGRIDSEFFLGGKLELSKEKAQIAIEKHVASEKGISIEMAADEIINKVEQDIKESILKLGLNGIDTIVAYGGAGPMHMTGLVKEEYIKKLIITPYSAVFSAFGESMMGVLHTYTRPLLRGSRVEDLISQMEMEAKKDMKSEGFVAKDIKFEVDAISYDSKGRIDKFVSAQGEEEE